MAPCRDTARLDIHKPVNQRNYCIVHGRLDDVVDPLVGPKERANGAPAVWFIVHHGELGGHTATAHTMEQLDEGQRYCTL